MGAEPNFFNDRGEIKATRNRLPHWEQHGCTYFLTFRLADSLPQKVLDEWKAERRIWLGRHSEPWADEVEQEYHQRFSAARERWLDAGYGECALRGLSAREAFVCNLRQHDCELWSFVVMPNHVHLLLSLGAEAELPELMQCLKGGSAFEVNKTLQRSGRLWAKDYFDRLVRDAGHFAHCARYIRRNPVKAKLPKEAYTLVESAYVERVLDGS